MRRFGLALLALLSACSGGGGTEPQPFALNITVGTVTGLWQSGVLICNTPITFTTTGDGSAEIVSARFVYQDPTHGAVNNIPYPESAVGRLEGGTSYGYQWFWYPTGPADATFTLSYRLRGGETREASGTGRCNAPAA